MKDEKRRILKMVEDGKITSEEGVELLEALDITEASHIESQRGKWLKIRIFDPKGNNKVNVTVPVSLLNAAMRIAGKIVPNFVPELKEAGLDEMEIMEIFDAIQQGASGKLVDIESDEGEKVEIVVE